MTEMPPEAFASAPPGTPHAERSQVADVWCSHGVRWSHDRTGYVPVDQDAAHPATPCVDAGAIPRECQPVTAYDPADHPTIGPRAVEEARRELGYGSPQ